MNKLTVIFILSLTSISFAQPSAQEVAAAILGDSQMEEATGISELQYTVRTNGTDRHTEHTLKFKHQNQVYNCDNYKLTTTPVGPGEHFVLAEISRCENSAGKKLILKNDYTNDLGRTVFRRVFFNDGKKFRLPDEEEEKIVRNRDRQYFRNSSRNSLSGVKVLNTNDLEDGVVIIDSTGEVFGIN